MGGSCFPCEISRLWAEKSSGRYWLEPGNVGELLVLVVFPSCTILGISGCVFRFSRLNGGRYFNCTKMNYVVCRLSYNTKHYSPTFMNPGCIPPTEVTNNPPAAPAFYLLDYCYHTLLTYCPFPLPSSAGFSLTARRSRGTPESGR